MIITNYDGMQSPANIHIEMPFVKGKTKKSAQERMDASAVVKN